MKEYIFTRTKSDGIYSRADIGSVHHSSFPVIFLSRCRDFDLLFAIDLEICAFFIYFDVSFDRSITPNHVVIIIIIIIAIFYIYFSPFSSSSSSSLSHTYSDTFVLNLNREDVQCAMLLTISVKKHYASLQ